MKNVEVNENLFGLRVEATPPPISTVGVYVINRFLMSSSMNSTDPTTRGMRSQSILEPPHDIEKNASDRPESIPDNLSFLFQLLVKNTSVSIMKNVPVGSFSKNPAEVRRITPGITARKNAANTPVCFPKISLPKKYIPIVDSAPIRAG